MFDHHSYNRVHIIGYVGQDPEVRYTSNGKAVANLSVATTLRLKNEDRTEWHRITVWDKAAEFVEQYVFKGDKVFVEGRLQTRSWEKDGVKRYSTEVVSMQIQKLNRDDRSRNTQSADTSSSVEEDLPEDDLPF